MINNTIISSVSNVTYEKWVIEAKRLFESKSAGDLLGLRGGEVAVDRVGDGGRPLQGERVEVRHGAARPVHTSPPLVFWKKCI